MKMRVYSILDVKARAFGQLLVFNNDEMARRAMSSPPPADSEVAKWPGDFHMFYVGSFDTDNGVLVGEVPTLLATFGETLSQG